VAKKPKLHIHVQGEVIYNYGAGVQVDRKWQHNTKALSVWAIMYEQMTKLKNFKALHTLSVDYIFLKNEATEELDIDVTPLEDVNTTIRMKIYSCWCDKKWETKGSPPF